MRKRNAKGRPGHGFGVLAALSLAMVLAAGLWLRLGWQSCRAVLTDLAGDAGKLRGFTVSAAVLDGSDRQEIILRDGYLESEYHLDGAPAGKDTALYNVADVSCAVAPQAREALNAGLTASESDGDLWYSGTTREICEMLTLCLPDDTSLRLSLGEVQAAEPLTFYCRDGEEKDFRLGGYSGKEFAWLPYRVAPRPLRLGDAWGVAWGVEAAGLCPGLYRVTASLTEAQVWTLPADGYAGRDPVLCKTTPYGSMEPYYCPKDAQEVLDAFVLGEGVAVLYLDGDGQTCVDLLDAAGQCTERQTFRALEQEPQGVSTVLMPRRSADEAVLFLRSYLEARGEWVGAYLALRVQDGKLALAVQTPVEDGDILLQTECAALNRNGDALLTMRRNVTTAESLYGSSTWNDGYLVEVWPLGGTNAVYRGFLDTGLARDWGYSALAAGQSGYWEPNLLHQTVFFTLPADRGES